MQQQALALLAQIRLWSRRRRSNNDDAARRLIIAEATGASATAEAKPGDCSIYRQYGVADLGVVGEDVLAESGRDVYEPLRLPFGHCRLVVAGWAEAPLATAAPGVRSTRRHQVPQPGTACSRKRGISTEIIALSGSWAGAGGGIGRPDR
ncbi:MAG: hypothetical protein IPO15_03025 [Anaerolineae bacterium]|uniref:hypothetical protein n=1 Tax=Candidatus Amarolinea dominans TaxID=3140696 RepID=UPI0031372790|nr:hypothetical protein [Anaerolineae bacterium]